MPRQLTAQARLGTAREPPAAAAAALRRPLQAAVLQQQPAAAQAEAPLAREPAAVLQPRPQWLAPAQA